MRIGIVGGGAAGLAAAWMLEEQHDVTIFERETRLGGHAHTVDAVIGDETVPVDAGFQFFGPGTAYATFNRLLDALDVPRTRYPATMTLDDRSAGRATVLPPMRDRRPVWSSLTPRAVRDLLAFRRLLAGIPSFLARHDTETTAQQYVATTGLPRGFTEGFLFPLLQALWCVEADDIRSFSAYNTFFYFGETLVDGMHPPTQLAIDGGMRTYVDALAARLAGRVVLDADIRSIHRDGDVFEVTDAAGRRELFDQVVIATSAERALDVLRPVVGLDAMRTHLRRIEYFDTTIAVHGDARLMPARRSAWSVVNARWDGAHSQVTVWDPSREVQVFRSWVTFDERMPDPLYGVVRYRHGRVTPDYFDAQRALKAMQGTDGVWLAGLYMDDADSHESAVRSAVAVARRLVPDSERLRSLVSPAGG